MLTKHQVELQRRAEWIRSRKRIEYCGRTLLLVIVLLIIWALRTH